MRRRGLFPPADSATGKRLKAKGQEPRSTLTSNGRVSIVRQRWQAMEGGSVTPVGALVDHMGHQEAAEDGDVGHGRERVSPLEQRPWLHQQLVTRACYGGARSGDILVECIESLLTRCCRQPWLRRRARRRGKVLTASVSELVFVPSLLQQGAHQRADGIVISDDDDSAI